MQEEIYCINEEAKKLEATYQNLSLEKKTIFYISLEHVTITHNH